jgi:hypothetical protein
MTIGMIGKCMSLLNYRYSKPLYIQVPIKIVEHENIFLPLLITFYSYTAANQKLERMFKKFSLKSFEFPKKVVIDYKVWLMLKAILSKSAYFILSQYQRFQ